MLLTIQLAICICPIFPLYLISCIYFVLILQYKEILGKGAFKTVYGSKTYHTIYPFMSFFFSLFNLIFQSFQRNNHMINYSVSCLLPVVTRHLIRLME